MVLKGPGARAGGWGETRAPSLIFPTHSVRGVSLCLGGSLPLFIALPSRDLLLGKGRSLLFFYASGPSSPRSSCRHSSFNAVPPIRQRFSWSRRVSHTIAPHLTHMDACSRSSTGYHTPARVWP